MIRVKATVDVDTMDEAVDLINLLDARPGNLRKFSTAEYVTFHFGEGK